MATNTVFHALPPELLIRILHQAAISSTTTCLALSLVSSWARLLALPYLYSTAIFTDRKKVRCFTDRVIINDKLVDLSGGARKVSALVRGVWLGCAGEHGLSAAGAVYALIVQCRNLVYLAGDNHIFFELSHKIDYPPAVSFHLTIIQDSASLDELDPVYTPGQSWFIDAVTHVNFLSVSHYVALPRVTHVAIPITHPNAQMTEAEWEALDLQWIFERVLALPKLEMLVFIVYVEDEQCLFLDLDVLDLRKSNPRVYILRASREHARDDWREEASGGKSLWDRAYAFTKRWEAGDHE